MNNEKGYSYSCHFKKFGQLKEPLDDYNEDKLKRWQQQAADTHQRLVRRIKELYWEGKEIPEDWG